MASDASALPGPRSFRASGPTYIATIAVGHGLKHWYIAAFAVFLPLIVEEYELTATGVTAIAIIKQFGGGFPNFFVGYVSDRLSGYWHLILPFSFFFAALFMMLSGLAPWVWPVIALASLGGLAASFWHPPAISMLSTRFPDRKGMAIAYHGSGSGAGEALGPLAVGFILAFWLAGRLAALHPPQLRPGRRHPRSACSGSSRGPQGSSRTDRPNSPGCQIQYACSGTRSTSASPTPISPAPSLTSDSSASCRCTSHRTTV